MTIRKLLFGAAPPSSSNLPFSILSSVLLSYSVNFDFSSSKNAFGLFFNLLAYSFGFVFTSLIVSLAIVPNCVALSLALSL